MWDTWGDPIQSKSGACALLCPQSSSTISLPSPVPQPRSQWPRDTLIPPERPGVLTLITHMTRHFVSTWRARGHTHTHSHLERCSQAGRQMGRATVNSKAAELLGRSWGGEGTEEDWGGNPGPRHCPAGATGEQRLLAAETRSDRVSPRQRPGVTVAGGDWDHRKGSQHPARCPSSVRGLAPTPELSPWALAPPFRDGANPTQIRPVWVTEEAAPPPVRGGGDHGSSPAGSSSLTTPSCLQRHTLGEEQKKPAAPHPTSQNPH